MPSQGMLSAKIADLGIGKWRWFKKDSQKDPVWLLLKWEKTRGEEMLQMVGKPSVRGTFNADDETPRWLLECWWWNDGKQKLFLVGR
jgi:hypothetical protein